MQPFVYREKNRREGKDADLRITSADGPSVKDIFPKHGVQLPVRQEVGDPPAEEVRLAAAGRACPAAEPRWWC